jgi:hypothetical protein
LTRTDLIRLPRAAAARALHRFRLPFRALA